MSKLTLSFKGRVLKVYPLLEGELLIGHNPACYLYIDSLALEPKHARIMTNNQQSTLYDLNTPEGTFVNQQRIKEHKLRDGDLILIGKHTLSYKFEDVSGAGLAVPDFSSRTGNQPPVNDSPPANKTIQEGLRSAWLQILNGQNLGKTLSLNRKMTNLGKPGIAAAVIARRSEGYFLSHLEGKHPPTVCSSPIGKQSHKLIDGDIIQIGNVKMQFYFD